MECNWVQGLSSAIVVVTVISAILFCCRCKHAWELADKTELPAPLEEARKSGVVEHLMPCQIERMSKRTLILALRCPKCGTSKIFRESA